MLMAVGRSYNVSHMTISITSSEADARRDCQANDTCPKRLTRCLELSDKICQFR